MTNWMGTTCWSDDGTIQGKVVGISHARRCPVEDCTGRQLGIRWADGKLTWVCEMSMVTYHQEGVDGLRIGDESLWMKIARLKRKWGADFRKHMNDPS
jgi:hypothetical protein